MSQLQYFLEFYELEIFGIFQIGFFEFPKLEN